MGSIQPNDQLDGAVTTRAGLSVIAHLMAGDTLTITRVMVGNGRFDDDLTLQDAVHFTDLLNPIAQATATTPVVNNLQLEFIVDYRNDMNGGLTTGFRLSEFGIFALHPLTDEEVLVHYANLGDYPQWVQPFSRGGLDIRRYPVSIGLSSDVNVVLQYPSTAFLTGEDLENRIAALERTLTSTLTQQLQAHLLDSIFSENGVHGLRYFKGRLQVRINNEWQVVGVLDNDNIGTGSNLLHFNGAALFDGVHRFNGEVSASEVISNEE